ncbi:uncharacterized protein LOC142177296 [Nicotiana tabacum]|uniref:Uncharacterized protein LOC142177296 n=1 Tax=Nicotiana tabacum TaxID=4097 RepID=A0AC58TXF1_TOBAC
MLREDQAQKLEELLMLGEVDTRSRQNQELGLQRPGDTRWGYNFKTVYNFIVLFSSIIHVLEVLASEGANYLERSMAKSLLSELNSHFDALNSDLLLGMASLSPDNSFTNYDKERIMKLAKLYPHEYSISKLEDLN